MMVKCPSCSKTFSFEPESVELLEHKQIDVPEKKEPDSVNKSWTVRCPHCGAGTKIRR